MAIVKADSASVGWNMLAGAGLLFDAPADYAEGNVFSWTTADGDYALASGGGFQYDGGVPTSGLAVYAVLDLGADDVNSPDVMMYGFVIDLPDVIEAATEQELIDAVLSLNDDFTGSDFADTLKGGGGADTIDGGTGDDSLLGGDGGDVLYGGDGADTLTGGYGNDLIYDDSGALPDGGNDDWLEGGPGDDTLWSVDGNDTIVADNGTDVVGILGDSADHLTLYTAASTIIDLGSTFATDIFLNSQGVVSGGSLDFDIGAAQTLFTGHGNDVVYEGGLNVVDLGAGNDHFFGVVNAGTDVVAGGEGRDTLESNGTWDVTVNLNTGQVGNSPNAAPGFEDFIGSTQGGNDDVTAWNGGSFISGDVGDDRLQGMSGRDTLLGGSGRDSVFGGGGSDSLEGGEGDDSLTGYHGHDTMSGGDGNDTLLGQSQADVMDGGNGNDTMNGGDGPDSMMGNDGSDTLYGGNGTDTLIGGDGNDLLQGVVGSDVIFGETGNDTIYGGYGLDTIEGGAGQDYIDGGNGADWLYGGTWSDVLAGNTGSDVLFGGEAHDTLMGQGGNDTLYGEIGNDRLEGGVNQDFLYGGEGDDTLEGGTGVDRFIFADNAGNDLIEDFLPGVDQLDFSSLAVLNDFDDFQAAATQVGDDLIIDLGADGTLILWDVTFADIVEGDVIF